MKKLCILLPLMLILTSFVLADGGFFPPVYYDEDIYEPTQKGLIIHDGTTEQLVIQATYKGELTEFAWVIPTPEYPEVEKASSYLFEELHWLTEPNYKRGPAPFLGVMSPARFLGSEGVTVHEQKQVGIYEVSILSSDDPEALVIWLNENNYRISSKAEPILDYYIEKEWYFIAMRINLVPFDETLINSLKEINPEITSSQDAVLLLTDDLVEAVKAEITYDKLTDIRTAEIDYGEDDSEEVIGSPFYWRDRQDKPQKLITQSQYTTIYEQYNGYLEPHMLQTISQIVGSEFNLRTRIPNKRQCERRSDHNMDYSDCHVWYFTQALGEYQLLKDVSCGIYCSLVDENKETFSSKDLAKVAAYAAIKGDQDVKNYFHLDLEKEEWYENDLDRFNMVVRSVESQLNNVLYEEARAIESQKEKDLLEDYSYATGQDFGTTYQAKAYFADKIHDDFKLGRSYSDSYIAGMDVLNVEQYNSLKEKHDGDHDGLALRNNVEEHVKNVVFWKQNLIQEKLGEGTVQPVLIKFETDQIIYPLKISSVNKGVSEVLLYVFAKYRTKVSTIKGFEVEYAKWIETDDIKTDAYYHYVDQLEKSKTDIRYYWSRNTYYYLNQLLDDRYFLTKFRKEMWPKEMTDDLILVQEEHNKEYVKTVYADNYVLNWIFFIIALGFLWGFWFGTYFFPRWLNNLRFKTKPLYVSVKRLAAYAAVIPVIFLFAYLWEDTFGRWLSNFLSEFVDGFEFIAHLLNFLYVHPVGQFFFILALIVIITFAVFHVIGTYLVLLYDRIKRKD